MSNDPRRARRWAGAWLALAALAGSPAHRSLLADGFLGGAGIIACAAFLSGAFGWAGQPPVAVGPAEAPIAALNLGSGVVRRRPLGELAWQDARPGDSLLAGDTLYVPPNVSAQVRFRDGALLDLQEAALVVIDRAEEVANLVPRVDLVRGSLAVRAPHRLLVAARGHRVLLDRGQARLQVGDEGTTRVSVDGGRARLETAGQTADLVAAEAAKITSGGAVRPVAPPRIRLALPADGAHVVHDGGPVVLIWEQDDLTRYRVEIAEDADFAQVTHRAEVKRSSLPVSLLPGIYHWRVTAGDSAEPLTSEQRMLHVVDPRSLVALRPSEQDAVRPSEETTFSWTALMGADRYRVEVARDPAMTELVLVREAQSNSLRDRAILEEGKYWWRVGATMNGAISAWSEPKALRVTRLEAAR